MDLAEAGEQLEGPAIDEVLQRCEAIGANLRSLLGEARVGDRCSSIVRPSYGDPACLAPPLCMLVARAAHHPRCACQQGQNLEELCCQQCVAVPHASTTSADHGAVHRAPRGA